MNVPYDWLLEYLETDLPPEKLAEVLTMAGLEVEAVEQVEGRPVLVTKVTANRGDLLSMLGVAREAAANLRVAYRRPDVELQEGGTPIAELIEVRIDAPDLCPRYSARLIRGLKVGPSPDWLAQKLRLAGLRPINNVVDATNYVMWEYGQPLHAFDYDLLHGRQIIVRTAEAGETIVTIDEERRQLDTRDLVIADADRPVALAGVMGGYDTEVHERTESVLLESAHFNPASIRLTAQRHGMMSESSYRFERIVDPAGTIPAVDRVAQIIVETGGGEVAQGIVDQYLKPREPMTISLRPARANQVLGVELSPEEMRDVLRRLEFEVADTAPSIGLAEGPLEVTVPTFRPDVEREIDLVEEVARIHGYDNIPLTLHPARQLDRGRTPRQQLELLARDVLLQCGLSEAVNYAMVHPRDFDRLGLRPDDPLRQAIRLANPVTEDHQIMRTTTMPSLLQDVALNAARRVLDVALFEIDRVFLPVQGQELPAEPRRIGAVASGRITTSGWNLADDATTVDFFWLKGVLEQLLDALGVPDAAFRPAQHPTFHPGRCAEVTARDEPLGIIGEVARSVQEAYEIPHRTYLFEVDLDALAALAQPLRRYGALPIFPPAKRDLAVVVRDDEEHSCQALLEQIRRGGGELLRRVQPFDVYRDPERLGAGMKSMAFSLEFRAEDRTLTDEEVDQLMQDIEARLAETLHATIRTQ
ncbi:MAG: phenylalanine--tRNA ligase subunit beta [Armatimonadota bacterium]